jgi:hypothetical protein
MTFGLGQKRLSRTTFDNVVGERPESGKNKLDFGSFGVPTGDAAGLAFHWTPAAMRAYNVCSKKIIISSTKANRNPSGYPVVLLGLVQNRKARATPTESPTTATHT